MRVQKNSGRKLWPLPIGLAILVSFLVPLHLTDGEGIWNALGNAAHYPLMAAFTLAALTFWGASYASVGLAAAATAALLELIQPMFGRTESAMDLIFGLFGVSVALVGHRAWRNGGGGLRLAHALLALALGLVVSQPIWQEWRVMHLRAVRFPVLGDFEDETELRLWRDRSPAKKWPTTLKLSSEHVSSGRRALAVRTGSGSWPGVTFFAGGMDWRGYSRLGWDIYNPGEPFRLTIRIDDEVDTSFEGSFHRALAVATGWNRYEIPLEQIRSGPRVRDLDLGRIRRVYFYAEGEQPRRFFLDHVRLMAASGGGV